MVCLCAIVAVPINNISPFLSIAVTDKACLPMLRRPCTRSTPLRHVTSPSASSCRSGAGLITSCRGWPSSDYSPTRARVGVAASRVSPRGGLRAGPQVSACRRSLRACRLVISFRWHARACAAEGRAALLQYGLLSVDCGARSAPSGRGAADRCVTSRTAPPPPLSRHLSRPSRDGEQSHATVRAAAA